MERLHQTHDSLRAYRPPGGVESILGRAALNNEDQQAATPVAPEIPEIQPVATAPEPDRPWWLLLVNTGQVPEGGFVTERITAQPRWPSDGLAGSDPAPLDYSRALRRPLAVFEQYDCGFEPASAVGLDLATAKSPAAAVDTRDLNPLNVAIDPVCRLVFDVNPEPFQFEPESEPEEIPPFAHLLTLNQITALETSAPGVCEPAPVAIQLRAQLPLDAVMRHATLGPAALVQAGLHQIPMNRPAMAAGPWIDNLGALDLRAGAAAPLFTLSTPPLRPRLRLASGRRYAVDTQHLAAPAKALDTSAMTAKTPGVSLPKRNVEAIPVAPAAMPEPEPAGKIALNAIAHPSAPSIVMRPAPAAMTLPQPAKTEPIRPRSKLEPMTAKPVLDVTSEGTSTMPPLPIPSDQKAEPTGNERANIWIHASDFWNRAPRDLKMLTFAIPVLLGLALHPSLPKVRVTARAPTGGLQKNFQRAVSEQFVNVRQTVLDRAAVALDEDFRSGLDDWASPGNASTEWTFDATGFVRPGPLAIYRPSMNLTDYQMQFLGMIDKKAMSWVVRAADFQNFYVVKLVVMKPGPLPTIGLTRYAVVNGKADSRVDTVVPVDARADMLYRVRLDVHDSEFALSVQGQMIDAWSESRLPRGGIGFFSARGEESRLRWVQVTHQYDMLGRLCAYLAPYNFSSTSNGMTSTTGSWQP